MDNILYFVALAEQMLVKPGSRELIETLRYRPGKDFKDLAKLIKDSRQKRTTEYQKYLFCMAKRLTDIVEIDTNEPIEDYIKKLRTAAPRGGRGLGC